MQGVGLLCSVVLGLLAISNLMEKHKIVCIFTDKQSHKIIALADENKSPCFLEILEEEKLMNGLKI